MYIVLLENDTIDTEFRSPVAADLRIKQLARQGVKAYRIFDEGAC